MLDSGSVVLKSHCLGNNKIQSRVRVPPSLFFPSTAYVIIATEVFFFFNFFRPYQFSTFTCSEMSLFSLFVFPCQIITHFRFIKVVIPFRLCIDFSLLFLAFCGILWFITLFNFFDEFSFCSAEVIADDGRSTDPSPVRSGTNVGKADETSNSLFRRQATGYRLQALTCRP